jgi:hypothetical protein
MALEQSAQLSVQEALTLCAGTGLFSTNSTPEKSCDLRGFSSLFDLIAAVAVAVGMWKPMSFAGFQAPRASGTASADVPSSSTRSAISTARPQFIGHSGENVSFWAAGERK